ncbi:MAG: molecular chaperone DnaJ [Clostridiales bacterium]|nr:molecular chaperone DnaJ [Clostridiales bacterium]
MAKRDYYEVLGIDRGADDAAIKKAYRAMAKKYHPDVNPGDKEAEEKFKDVNEAYSVLSDPQKRARYDQFGHEDPAAGGGQGGAGFGGFSGFEGFSGFGGFDDLFNMFTGGSTGSTRRNGPVQGDDIRMNITLTFEEAAKGCAKEINLSRTETCEECKGTGAKPGTKPQTCTRCHGTGVETVIANTAFGRVQNRRACSACNGRGVTISDPCPKCQGRGKIRTNRRRSVNIPAGVDEGQIITIYNQGNAGDNGGPAGDLQLFVTIKPHKLFSRDGADLYIEVPISFTQAALGAEIDVPTLDKPLKYTVPEGTQPGTQFKVKGMGIPYVRSSNKGDLYITIRVEVPKRLTEKQKEILRIFDESTTGKEYEQKRSFLSRVKEAFGG